MSGASSVSEQTIRGIVLCGFAYSLFAVQDAIVKLLVADYAVPQVLFVRSGFIILIACFLSGSAGPGALLRSQHKMALLVRAVLVMIAWMLYYTAARELGLAELTTLYFAAPIVVVGLSALLLREQVGLVRWLVVFLGFGGVILAAAPDSHSSSGAAAMALMAAFCWGLSSVLIRMISRTETTANQMLSSNGLFLIACGAVLPWVWKTPDLSGSILLVALGGAGGLAQYLIFESFRHAPASALAPVEYTGLVSAFLLGYLVWGDVPGMNVYAGAVIIALSGLTLVWSERRKTARSRT